MPCRIGLADKYLAQVAAAPNEIAALAAAGGVAAYRDTGADATPSTAPLPAGPAEGSACDLGSEIELAGGTLGLLPPCDAADPEAIRVLAATTRVLLACLPNFRCGWACNSWRQPLTCLFACCATWPSVPPDTPTACRAALENLVRACAEAGTHYFDLSVEIDLNCKVRTQTICAAAASTSAFNHHRTTLALQCQALYGAVAKASGALIVPCCGLDQVLADFGAMQAACLFEPPAQLRSIEGIFRALPGVPVVLRESTFLANLETMDTPAFSGSGPNPAPAGDSWLPLQWSDAAGCWTLPGHASELDVVGATQAHLAACQPGLPSAPYTPLLAAQSPAAALAFASIGSLFSLAHWRPVRAALRAVALPLLRWAGLLTTNLSVYEASMRRLAMRKLFVARGCAIPGAAEEGRVLEIEGSSTSAGLLCRICLPCAPSAATSTAASKRPRCPCPARPPGLAFTPVSLAQAAWTTLQLERSGKGVHVTGLATPAAAFHTTAYWETLLERVGLSVQTRVAPAAPGAAAKAKVA